MEDSDQAALRRVIQDTHGKALMRYVLTLTRGQLPFAEDVVQESLLRLSRNPDVLRQPSEGVRAWLFTVARNQVIDNRRTPACDKWILADALKSLRRDHRVVLVRAHYLGQSVATIAEYEQIPEGTVKSRLHYALHAMRNTLLETGVAR